MEGQTFQGNLINDAFVKDRVIGNFKNGSIILMHVGDNITGNVLDQIFEKAKDEGYTMVPLSQGL